MPKVSEALCRFLQARKTPANADLIDRWSLAMETQVNVAAGDGEAVPGKRSTWSNGTDTWHSIRIPKDANSEPSWHDYNIGFPSSPCRRDWHDRLGLAGTALALGGFDFDSLTGHAKGVGIGDEELEKVKQAAMLPIRRSAQEHGRRRHPPLRLLR